MTTWLCFVPHADVPVYEARGWLATDNLTSCHHGRYAILMRWAGEGEPK